MNDSYEKKGILWNVLEPGDAYDIRRSLIARMPGDRKIFMGEHVDMVCLLQAVEIERLMEYLNDYKLKFKEIERNQFDRHYLERQIKQLMEMNADSESLRIEVTKLKDFIRRLSEELENERKQSKTVDHTLQIKYNQSLSQLDLLISEKEQLMMRVSELESSLGGWKSRYEALDRTRLRELEELRGESQRHSLLDKELRELNSRLSLERNQYELQIRHLKQQIQTKDRQINDFHIQISETNRSISFKQTQLLKKQQTKQYKFKEQIQFLNNQLMNKSMEYQELMIKYQTLMNQNSERNSNYDQMSRRISIYENESKMLNTSLHKLQLKLNERAAMDGKLEDSQNQVALLSQQISRLQYMNASKSKQVEEWSDKYKKVGYEYESLRRQYLVISNRLTEQDKSQGTIRELQTSIMRLTQQNSILKGSVTSYEQKIQRLNIDLQKPQPELIQVRRQLSIFSQENIKFRAKISQLTMALDQSTRSQISVAQLEKRIRMLENQRDHAIRQSSQLNRTISSLQHQAKITMSEEYQRKYSELRSVLESERKRNTAEKESYQHKIKAMTDSHEQQIRAIQLEFSRKSLDDESQIISKYNFVVGERDTLNEIAHELQERIRSFGGEERIIRFNEQIERLSRKLREKNEQMIDYERRLKEYDHFKIKYNDALHQIETLRKKIQLLEPVQNKQQQFKIISLTKEVESLKKQLAAQDYKAKIVDYEKRVTLFSGEIDRLNEKNDALKEDNQNWRQKYNSLILERDEIDRIAHQLQQKVRLSNIQSGDLSALRIKSHEYEQKIVLLTTDIQRLSALNKRLQGGGQSYQTTIHNLNIEIERLKGVIDKEISIQGQHEKKLTTMSHQISRLNGVLQDKINQIKQLHLQITRLNKSIEKSRGYEQESIRLRQSIRHYETQIKGLEAQIRASTVGLHSLKGENDSLKIRISDLELGNRRVSEIEIERDQLRRQLEQRAIEFTSISERLRIAIDDYNRVQAQLKYNQESAIEVTRIKAQFNQKIILMTQDNQRLKSLYDQSLRKSSGLQLTIQKLNNQLELMDIRIREVDSYPAREERFRLEIERLNQSVIVKQSQIAGLQKTITQLEIGKQRAILSSQELEKLKLKNSELVGRISEYESRIYGYTAEIDSYRTKLEFSNQKIRKMNEIQSRQAGLVREKELIIVQLNNEINEYKQKLLKINGEWNIKISNSENSFRTLEKENENLQRYLDQSRIQIKRLEDAQSSLRIQLSQEWSAQQSEYRSKISRLETHIYQNQIKMKEYEHDNERLRIKETDYEYEINGYKSRIAALEEEITTLRMKIRQIEFEREGYESRLLNVGNQIERLNQVLREKVEKIEFLNRRISSLTSELNQSKLRVSQLIGENEGLKLIISELNIKIENGVNSSNRIYQLKIEEKDRKILQFQNKLALLSQQIQRLEQMKRTQSEKIILSSQRLSLTENKLSQYQTKFIMMAAELEKLNGVLRTKLQIEQQLIELRIQNDKLRKSLNQKIEAEANATTYLQQIERLNNILRIKVQQSKEMESSRYLSLQNDAKMAGYSNQIDRLNRQLRIKLDQNRELKQKLIEANRDSDSLRDRYNQAVREYELSRKKYLETEERLPRLNAEFDNLNRMLLSQKQEIAFLKQQNYNLTVQLSNGSTHLLEQKNRMLADQIKRLTVIIEQHMFEISELRLRYVDDNALEKRINEHLALFVVLFAEIESLRKRVKDKEKEVNDVRRSSLATYIVNPPS